MAEMSDHQDTDHFTYDRSWDEIEKMLDRAERKQNEWVTIFFAAREKDDKSAMREAARNKKALEGVIKTLRWALGDKNILHPLE
jgi:Glu-tRNA(Gln) amidotransferase subunit E-like FAD-binding protein